MNGRHYFANNSLTVQCNFRDDVDSALNTFINFVEKYRITPLKSALTAKLIELEDAQRLQQVMDASIKVHGEMNSLYDLVFSFLECGRVRQAKKVLEVTVIPNTL